jgi:hypothetical protein
MGIQPVTVVVGVMATGGIALAAESRSVDVEDGAFEDVRERRPGRVSVDAPARSGRPARRPGLASQARVAVTACGHYKPVRDAEPIE